MLSFQTYYQFFAKCFYYPDAELASWIAGGPAVQILQAFSSPEQSEFDCLHDWLRGREDEKDLLEVLRIEYTRLFVTAFPHILAPPYQSFYQDGELFGKASGEVADIYQKHGLKIADQMKEPADHLALQLEFLYRVCEENKSEELEIFFIREHLLSWLDTFCDRLSKHTALPFYPYLANSLRAFLSLRVGQSNYIGKGVTL